MFSPTVTGHAAETDGGRKVGETDSFHQDAEFFNELKMCIALRDLSPSTGTTMLVNGSKREIPDELAVGPGNVVSTRHPFKKVT